MNNRERLVALFLLALSVISFSDVPRLINYQGKLVDGSGLPEEDPVNLTFSIWDASTGGNKIWEQVSVGVDPAHGLFSVELDFTTGWETGYSLDNLDAGYLYFEKLLSQRIKEFELIIILVSI